MKVNKETYITKMQKLEGGPRLDYGGHIRGQLGEDLKSLSGTAALTLFGLSKHYCYLFLGKHKL